MNKLTTDEHKILVDAIHDSATIIHKGQMMNERIKQLWEESQQWNGSDDGRGGLKILESVDKFAELIVRECADICMEMTAKCAGLPGDGALAKDCADWIKKDFGVEE
jgi:hypothetical protein